MNPVDLDRLWDYSRPEKTERTFRELLAEVAQSGSESDRAELLTQIARAQGLQRQFDEAHATLDEVRGLLGAVSTQAQIRYELERGRVFNSAGAARIATIHFQSALELATAEGADYYSVDALHMLAIAEGSGATSLELNRQAIAVAKRSDDKRVRNWLGALLNNLGWAHYGLGEYTAALRTFEKALAFRRDEKHSPKVIQIARYCVAKVKRALGLNQEALAEQ